jgi:drug/metabolite transporter (DMT)-like permease
MSLTVLYAAVLFSALTHASWNAMVKTSGDRLLMLASIRTLGLVLGIIVALIVPLPSAQSVPWLIAAAAMHYLYYALLLNAYRLGDISQVYPISRGTAPLLVVVLGIFFAGELLDRSTLLGIFILSSGLFVLSVSGSAIQRLVLVFAFGTGITIAGYSFLSGMGIRESATLLGYIAWLEIAKGAGLTLFAWHRRRGQIAAYLKSNWRSSLVAGFLSVGSFTVSVAVMSVAPIAPVVALRVTSVVFAAIIGSLFLQEGFAGRRITAAVVVVIGVVLIGLSAA